MKLLRHYTSKDTAIELWGRSGDLHIVRFWNIAALRINEKPFGCGHGLIHLQPRSEYEEIEVWL